MLAGASCIVPASLNYALRVLMDLAFHRVTHLSAVPFELAAVVATLERTGARLPDHLRAVVLGSAPVLPAFLVRLRAVCGAATDVWCAYGMSEMFPVALVESREKLAYVGEGDLVGHAVDGAHASLAADGELVVSGPHLFAGYAGLPATPTHASGDLARIDPDGRIVLLGRKKDMIIRGHHNIYPALYEDSVAAVAGVEACAFVGLPQPDQTDERVVLAIEPRAGENAEALRRRVVHALADGPQAIDRFALPDHVLVCRLPRSGRSHKIDRARLARWAADALRSDARAVGIAK